MIEEEIKPRTKKVGKKAKKKKALPKIQNGPENDWQIHEIVIDPDEEILMEGDIMKFKPGIEKNFITRWI